MNLLQLIAAIEFNGATQDSCDLATLLAEQEVNEAIARGEIPRGPAHATRLDASVALFFQLNTGPPQFFRDHFFIGRTCLVFGSKNLIQQVSS
jgi:hypothetical protein